MIEWLIISSYDIIDEINIYWNDATGNIDLYDLEDSKWKYIY
jgi:hypothetical protein